MRQDEDVLDTWFSSQLWPFATFGWPEPDPRVDYFYPTSVLSTARDILFLWVARMVMSGMYFDDGEIPFDDVIIHPTVFNAEGRRMSKSLGTGVDPLDLMEHYGADGMRFGLMLQVTGNQDIRFSEDKLLSSRNFANKIWNASRFVLMHLDGYTAGPPVPATVADRWILSRLAGLSARVSEGLDTYQFGDVSRDLYDFFWSEFCDWYIELAKARLAAGGEQRLAAQRNLVFVLDRALRLLHPMMPFVTEEIWRRLPLPEDDAAPSLMVAAWPDPRRSSSSKTRAPSARSPGSSRSSPASAPCAPATSWRRDRRSMSSSRRRATPRTSGSPPSSATWPSLAGVASFSAGTDAAKPPHSATVIASGLEVYVPLEGLVDFEAEAARLTSERDKLSGELEQLESKLGNEGFLAKAAPEVIEKDRAKAADLAESLALVEGQLAELA